MYATEFNIVETKPDVSNNLITGKYLRYPAKAEDRRYEGGMRCNGRFKRRSSTKPLVSVITTVFNRELTIEKAICSVLGQSYQNIEYILIDAASDDNTLAIIRKYEDVIDYVVSEPDGGIYEGMNKGVELAQGDYIIILNSDDWYFSDCIQSLVSVARERTLDMVCALAIETDMHGNEIRKIPYMPFGDNVYIRMPLRHETMLVSRNTYDSIGLYDTDFKIIADLKLSQNLYGFTSRTYQLSEYLMCFRKMGVAHEVTSALIMERKKLLLEQFPFLSETEVSELASDFSGNLSSYIKLAEKYPDQNKLIKGLNAFLEIRGAFRNRTIKQLSAN
jgi:glycosyltransferase involved in cell wall biosynthesis